MTQLCQLAGTWTGDHPPSGALIEQKLDGWRAIWTRNLEGLPRLFTRNGVLIEGVGHIQHRLEAMERAAGQPMVFDGEFQVGTTLDETKSWCERGYKQGGEAGTLYLFDCMSYEEWKAGGSDTSLIDRKTRLIGLWNSGEKLLSEDWDWRPGSRGKDADTHPVRVLPHEMAFERADVVRAAMRVWNWGGEGVVVKDQSSPYQRNRSGDWRKVGRPWQDKLGWKELT